jgi:ABC-type dipeptide/oligopeptide/nickel transport system permease subunit
VSLWSDAFRSLLRNLAAVIGVIVVILLALMAIFAPVIAPQTYSEQILTDHNVVPPWVVKVFPFMAGYARISNDYSFGADYVGRDIFSRAV